MVAPFPVEQVEAIIVEEFGKPPQELFAEFSSRPMAAASIGQVHAAKLKDGMEVVVKVRRPGIVETINTDLEIMRFIAGKMEEYSESFERMEPDPDRLRIRLFAEQGAELPRRSGEFAAVP